MNGAAPLTSQDPASLSNLRGLALPEPVPWWPLAPGAYALLALVALALGLIAWRAWRRWRRDAYRRAALAELAAWRGAGIPDPARLDALLKRVAIHSYGRARVAALSGEPWLRFLDGALDDGAVEEGGFRAGAGRALGDALYARQTPGADPRALAALAERWIRRHRAPAGEEERAC